MSLHGSTANSVTHYVAWPVPCHLLYRIRVYPCKPCYNKERSVHIKNLEIFNYDSEVDVPADTARRDYMEFVVEKVLSHLGDKKKPTTMSFKVKWLNYDDTHNSWEPWKNLRLCEALHEDLRDNKMKHFIPKNLEASV